MKTILLTGATGFVGTGLAERIEDSGNRVVPVVRRPAGRFPDARVVPDIDASTDWGDALQEIDTVMHLAARVHVMKDTQERPLDAFRRVNTLGTLQLARSAAAKGIARFVYLSTVKVNGESTGKQPFRETDAPHPADPYAVSKWEAEQGLYQVMEETGMEVVIVRPPLVYGPGVGGNFLRLLEWIQKGVPLPLAAVDNRRSLVGLSNLCDFLLLCARHPGAAGETFLVSDDQDLSTPGLLERIARQMGRSPRLWPLPAPVLRGLAALLGQERSLSRLTGSLRLDIQKSRTVLGWQPPDSVDTEIARSVAWFSGLGTSG